MSLWFLVESQKMLGFFKELSFAFQFSLSCLRLLYLLDWALFTLLRWDESNSPAQRSSISVSVKLRRRHLSHSITPNTEILKKVSYLPKLFFYKNERKNHAKMSPSPKQTEETQLKSKKPNQVFCDSKACSPEFTSYFSYFQVLIYVSLEKKNATEGNGIKLHWIKNVNFQLTSHMTNEQKWSKIGGSKWIYTRTT